MTTPIEITEEDRQKAFDLIASEQEEFRGSTYDHLTQSFAQALAEARSEGRRDTERLNWLEKFRGHAWFALRHWIVEAGTSAGKGATVRYAIDRSMEAEDSARRTE